MPGATTSAQVFVVAHINSHTYAESALILTYLHTHNHISERPDTTVCPSLCLLV